MNNSHFSRNGALASATLSGLMTAVFVAIAAISTPTESRAQIVMKISTATINDAQDEWIKRFTAAVTEQSGGRIKGERYPASQLGSIPRQIEATQLGAVQGWVGPPEFLSGIDKRFELMTAPGIFLNMEHARRVLADPEFAASFLKIAEAKNLKGVGLFLSGPNVIATRKPAQNLSDLKGLKIRVLASTIQLEQIKEFGATPVPMALGMVLPAIQQGTIDGLMTSLPVMTAFRYYDAAPYIIETNQSYVTSIATLSKRWFDGLPADLQKIVMDCAVRTTSELYPWIAKTLEEQRGVWTSGGGKFTDLTEAEHKAMMASLVKVSEAVFSRDPELNAMYHELSAAAKRNQ